jgi:hypothetical protein
MAQAVRRIDGVALLLASLAAPGSSFLIWGVWSVFTGGPGAAGLGEQILGGLLFLILVTVWGALPAAAFGTPVLLLIQRLFGMKPPLWGLVVAGMAAASLYAGCMLVLAYAGQAWVFLPAPWTTGVLDAEQRGFHGLTPMVTAIVLSGAVGGLTYWRAGRRRQA